jgi:hypothetical protein
MKLSHCHPDFQKQVEALAQATERTAGQVYALWENYHRECQAGDQSAIWEEFMRRHAGELGLRTFRCACCDGAALAREQWHDRDFGFGVCPRCFASSVGREGYAQAVRYYGRPGVHHSIGQAEADFTS